MPMPELMQLVNEAKKEVQEIGPSDLKRMQQSAEKFILIDVREPDEAARGTISGAIPIPRLRLRPRTGF
jgi:rhodanese-related sulfurtransferase